MTIGVAKTHPRGATSYFVARECVASLRHEKAHERQARSKKCNFFGGGSLTTDPKGDERRKTKKTRKGFFLRRRRTLLGRSCAVLRYS